MTLAILILGMLAFSATFAAALCAGWTVAGGVVLATVAGNLATATLVAGALVRAARS